MSHELRTPLNGLVGLAGLLAETDLSAEQRDYVSGIRMSGQALMGVIGGILDFSKIEAGVLTVDAADFEPAEVVAEVAALVAPTVREKNLDLVLEVDPSVPDRARGDAGRIRQILTNLLGNAVKFTDEGAVSVRLGFDGSRPRVLQFDVLDAGPGIADAARPFEPFWQADSSMTRHYGGTGLGLAIAERMVELLDGQIRYKNRIEGGAHFTFTVPYDEAEDEAFASPLLSGKRVLLADRDPERRRIVRRQLAAASMHVTEAGRPEDAFREVQVPTAGTVGYELVVVDRRDASHVPAREPGTGGAPRVLALTDRSRASAESLDQQADGVLIAPFGPSRLYLEVERMLGEREIPRDPGHRSPRGRLLLAEDDPTNRLFAVDLLRREGWEVEVALDGAAAVALSAERNYDAILMDCQMPKLDGYRATEQIRSRDGDTRHVPIIAVTAHATARERQRCLGAGMDGFVLKPFTVADIDKALRRELTRPRARRRARSAPSRAHEPESAPLLDHQKLADTDPAVRAELVDLFLCSARQRMEQLTAAISAGDARLAQDLAHALKGAAATMGAKRLHQVCDQLGRAIASGAPERVSARQASLIAVFTQTERALINADKELTNV